MAKSSSPTEFRAETQALDGVTHLALSGVVDENADLSPLKGLSGRVRMSLKGIRRINSFGVRSWIDAVRKIPESVEVEFVECPSPVVDQMNMVSGFLGRGKVISFFVPLVCEECDVERDQLVQAADCRGGKLPRMTCADCGQAMEIDDIEDQYLLFLREQS